MKKKPGRLNLHRETLERLDAPALGRPAAAGRTQDTCDISGCIECLPCLDGSSTE